MSMLQHSCESRTDFTLLKLLVALGNILVGGNN